jgi:hypothetical protein
MRLLTWPFVGLVVAAAAGCSPPGPAHDGALDVARAFVSAVTSGDGGTACSLLAPRAVTTLENDSGTACAEAVLDPAVTEEIGVGTSDGRGTARVYGRGAQVRVAGDVVFLAVDGSTWVVTAAGCRPRQDQPYDCAIEGS